MRKTTIALTLVALAAQAHASGLPFDFSLGEIISNHNERARERRRDEAEHRAAVESDEVVSAPLVHKRYRQLASERHPDKGGSDDAMAELNRARDEALEAIENA